MPGGSTAPLPRRLAALQQALRPALARQPAAAVCRRRPARPPLYIG
jgi:hypothetical protein